MEVVRLAKRLGSVRIPIPTGRTLALFGLLGVIGCGGDTSLEPPQEPVASNQTSHVEGGPEKPASSQPGRNPASGSQGETDSLGNRKPQKPSVVFRDTRASRPDWYQALAAKAIEDPRSWPSEALVRQVESNWRQCLQGELQGNGKPGLVPTSAELPKSIFFAPDFRAQAKLQEPAWIERTERSVGSVREARSFGEMESTGASAWWAHWVQIAGAKTGATLSVDVVHVQALNDGQSKLTLWIRMAEEGLFREIEADQIWSVPPGRRGSTTKRTQGILHSVQVLRIVETRSKAKWFQDRTRDLLPARYAGPRGLLYAGAVETVGRHDRLLATSTMYLGMHGLAVGDITGDGREDLYVGRAAGFANHLFVTQSDGTLHDVALEGGVADLDDTGGVLICDLDGDGHRDLVAGLGPKLVISWNDGAGRFPNRTVLDQGETASQIYSICAADADGDGDLDLYDTRYFSGGREVGAPTPYHDATNGAPNSFWRNLGDRQWKEATEEAGFDQNNDRFSLAALWEDLDSDGDLDLYVSNDFGRNNLFRNDGGKFIDIAESSDAVDMAASMGISAADVDRDGELDLYISNMHTPAGMRITGQESFQRGASSMERGAYMQHASGNTLLLGQGKGSFERSPHALDVGPGGWAWGAVFLDMDKDGQQDLFVPNGFATGKTVDDLSSFFWREVVAKSPLKAVKEPDNQTAQYLQAWHAITSLAVDQGYSWSGNERHFAYWNLGGGRFSDASGVSGLDLLEDGRGAAVVDWDLDGRPDLWLVNRTAPLVRFLHNQIDAPAHWIGIELAGDAPNPEAVGALIRVFAGEERQVARIYAGDSFLTSGSKRKLFGLGAFEGALKVEIQWPDGGLESHERVTGDRWLRIAKGSAPTALPLPKSTLQKPKQEPIPAGNGVPRDRVIPTERLPLAAWDLPSFVGPRKVVGDFNGPGLVVFFATWEGGGSEAVSGIAPLANSGEFPVHVVNLNGPRDADGVRAELDALGLLGTSGRGGRRIRNLVDTVLGEMVGAAKDRPLPIGMLFDNWGRLSAMYLENLPIDQIRNDLAVLRMECTAQDGAMLSLQDLDPSAEPLSGGSWYIERPRRSLKGLAEFLRRAGEEALARGMEPPAGPR